MNKLLSVIVFIISVESAFTQVINPTPLSPQNQNIEVIRSFVIGDSLELTSLSGGGTQNLIIMDDGIVRATPFTACNYFADAAQFVARTTNGAIQQTEEYATNDVMMDMYSYVKATETAAQVRVSVDTICATDSCTAYVYWGAASGASAADIVSWGVKARALSNDEAIDGSWGAEAIVDDAVTAQGDLMISAGVTFVVSGASADIIIIQVARKISDDDNMAENALLFGVQLYFH